MLLNYNLPNTTKTYFYSVLLLILITPSLHAQVVLESDLDFSIKASKLDQSLHHILDDLTAFGQQNIDLKTFPRNQFSYRYNKILVDLTYTGSFSVIQQQLVQMGFEFEGYTSSMISGRIAMNMLEELKNVQGLVFAYPVYKPFLNTGSVYSQADSAMNSDNARRDYGVTGNGQTIGILSDSYNTLNGEAAGISSGDLPAAPSQVVVLDDLTSTASDEGRAIAELIHDIAPDANLMFHTAFQGEADFATGIIELANAGCNIIVDDVYYFEEPWFMDGAVAQAVTTVANNNDVTYFSSAGNSAQDALESDWTDSNLDYTINGNVYDMHDFDPGSGVDERLSITIDPSSSVTLVFQWSDQYLKAGCAGANSDFDIFMLSGTSLITGSIRNNIGGDPIETISVTNNGSTAATVDIVIGKLSGSGPYKFILRDMFRKYSVDEYDNPIGTAVGHTNANEAISVGAAFFKNTPEYFVDPVILESFSSYGGVPVYYDSGCNVLTTPEDRMKPDLVGPDGTNTTFFGVDSPEDADLHPNFFGTSASAPNVAASTALLFEIASDLSVNLTAADMKALLTSTAYDMEGPGYDVASGFGYFDLDAAIGSIISLPVEFVNFEIEMGDKCEVLIIWEVDNPVNHSHFEIQKSTNGNIFKTIGQTILLEEGTWESKYSFIDTKPNEKSFYRIKQIDLDGQYMFSNVLYIEVGCLSELNWKTFPNPTSDLLTVSGIAEGSSLYIENIAGHRVKEIQNIRNEMLNIDLGNVVSGIYFITMQNGDEEPSTTKLIIER